MRIRQGGYSCLQRSSRLALLVVLGGLWRGAAAPTARAAGKSVAVRQAAAVREPLREHGGGRPEQGRPRRTSSTAPTGSPGRTSCPGPSGPTTSPTEYMRANSDHVYDVDKDGWPDVIAGGWGEDGIYWYKNPGNGRRGARAPPGRCTSPGRPTCWPRPAGTWRCSPCTTSTGTACPSCTRPATASRSRWRSGASDQGRGRVARR